MTLVWKKKTSRKHSSVKIQHFTKIQSVSWKCVGFNDNFSGKTSQGSAGIFRKEREERTITWEIV